MTRQQILGSVAILSILALGLFLLIGRDDGEAPDVRVEVLVPPLSPAAQQGQALFNENCADCHGENGVGSDVGPPLIHDIYKPSHHADASFFIAAQTGVRAHHWSFGDMPSQPHITMEMMRPIIKFVRETQAANGISMQ